MLGKPIPSVDEHDLLSDLLSALRLGDSGIYVFDFHGSWVVEIADFAMSFSWTVMEGTVWMLSSGTDPVAFRRDDTFLLPRGTCGKTYVLASAPDARRTTPPLRPQDVGQYSRSQRFDAPLGASRPLSMSWVGDGRGLTRVVSIPFAFGDPQLGPLVAALPDFLALRPEGSEADFIESLLRLLVNERDASGPGFSAMAMSSAQLLLTYVVRAYALSDDGPRVGAFAGLRDPRIARALACIHHEPERGWTVAALARTAGLSRSSFAERFLALVGQTPMQHLCAWRIHLAREALARGDTTVTALTRELGYQSEAAFRAAFRRITGHSPREFRKHRCGSSRCRRARWPRTSFPGGTGRAWRRTPRRRRYGGWWSRRMSPTTCWPA